MKMNRKSCALLNLAIAASLFAFAACSDYLEDFQDKYDDGKAFAEISSDSDDGSSDSKLSSSSKTGEGISSDKGSSSSNDDSELSSSSNDDSELSSSSNGNGNVDSSNSTGSSSSATNGEEAHCTGTVIYDYKNPGKLGLDLQFFTNGTATKLPENKQGIELTSNTVKDFAIFTLSKNDLHDVSSWEGLCVEYSSNEDIPFYLADSLENIEQINLPANDHFKEISWADTTSRKISLKGRVSFNKFDAFSFEKITTQKVVTISRITTIAKVAPGSSSSVTESSSAKKSCDGTVIYEPNMSNKFGEGVRILKNDSPVEDETDGFVLAMDTKYLLKFDTQNISDWGGLCFEYTTTYSFGIAVNNISDSITQTMIQTIEPGKHAISEIPWDNGSWDLLAIDNHSQQIDHIPNKSAILNEASQIFIRPSTSTESYGNQAKIHKITTMKQVDLKINSFQDGLVAVEKCDGDHQIIYNAPETKNVSSWGTNFFSTFTPETNATYNSTKNVLSMSMTAPESYQMNMVEVNEAETKDWGGLCIEYEADHSLFWSVSLLQNIELNPNTWDMGYEAAVVLPKTEGFQAYKISWKKFGELKNNSFAGIINTMQFHHANADEYHAADKSYNIEDYKNSVNLGIRRITSYN